MIGLPEGEQLKVGITKFVYLVLQREKSLDYPTCKIQQKLNFTITEIDVDTEEEIGSYEEDYDVPDIQLSIRDYV